MTTEDLSADAIRVQADPNHVLGILHACYSALRVCHNRHEWDEHSGETAKTWDELGDFLYPDPRISVDVDPSSDDRRRRWIRNGEIVDVGRFVVLQGEALISYAEVTPDPIDVESRPRAIEGTA